MCIKLPHVLDTFCSSKPFYKASIDHKCFDSWLQKKTKAHPQFLYWATALELQLLVLEYVRSIREGNFSLYIQMLGKLIWA